VRTSSTSETQREHQQRVGPERTTGLDMLAVRYGCAAGCGALMTGRHAAKNILLAGRWSPSVSGNESLPSVIAPRGHSPGQGRDLDHGRAAAWPGIAPHRSLSRHVTPMQSRGTDGAARGARCQVDPFTSTHRSLLATRSVRLQRSPVRSRRSSPGRCDTNYCGSGPS